MYYLPNQLFAVCEIVIVNLCLAELGFQIELWTGFQQEILSIRRVFGLITLVIAICFHAFERMPNVKIVDRSIYERLLRPTIRYGCIFENIGMEPSLKYIQ